MADAEVIRDAGDTLVEILREGVPDWLVPPERILVAGYTGFVRLPEIDRATLTVYLHRVEVRYKLRPSSQDRGLPLGLSYLLTPWAMDGGVEHQILGRVLQVIDRATVVPADLLTGESWREGDTLQFVIEDREPEQEFRLWEAMKLPYRPSVSCQAQVFSLDGAPPR